MILIADDNLDFAENCSLMLECEGYEVSVVSSGLQALARISDQQPDLLISDFCMPGMNGIQLSQQAKTKAGRRDMPILLMSGTLDGRVGLGISYDAFLKKPFLAQDFLLEVRKLLQQPAQPAPTH